jgi:UMF1 family MFS transporter
VLVAAYFVQAGAALQFYLLAVVIGFVLGGTQALSRSLFSQLIPPGREAEYFGFYEISDRGTSWLGPFLFALTYQLSGSYRNAIFSLVVFFVLGGILLARLPMRRAVLAAGNVPPERL